MSNLSITFHTSLSASLRSQWEGLWDTAKTGNIFNSPAWYDMAMTEYTPASVLIITAHEKERLVGILALTDTNVLGVSALAPLCVEYVVDDPFLFGEEREDLRKLFFQTLFTKGNVFLPKLRTQLAHEIQVENPGVFLHLMSVNPYVEIGQDPLRFVSHTNRKQLLRLVRKQEENWSFTVANTQETLKSALQAMFAIDLHSGKKQKNMDIFSKDENRTLFENFVKYFPTHVRIALLSYEQKPTAYIFNFVHGDYCLNYQTSYLAEHRKLSPGKIVIIKMLEYAKEQALRVFDFCGGISAYKQEFAGSYFVQYNLLYSRNPVIRSWWKVVTKIRRFKQQLFPIKYTRDHEFLFRTDLVADYNTEENI